MEETNGKERKGGEEKRLHQNLVDIDIGREMEEKEYDLPSCLVG